MKYPVQILPDGDAFVITSRDLPELNSVGYSFEDALTQALDGIETAFMIYMEDRKAIPLPSAAEAGEHLIALPVLVASKVQLYNEMLEQNVTKAELARRLGWIQKQADRLLSLKHSTKIESLENAFNALGKEIDVVIA
ncbi:type II toxin-antitoxin system HicB family antitoxin [Acinetobacter guillouiae]|uniref:type II toxin-antitoxin system HicB family antitoxin n=1 Tax=Acinetobacter guillouiae TaxID=106649 RepID=UPI0028D444F5|nr:type II toxin-antitoxin system HicB family antitoxin [Acinetobacter guillouiae]